MVARRPVPDRIDFSTNGPFVTIVTDLLLLLGVLGGQSLVILT